MSDMSELGAFSLYAGFEQTIAFGEKLSMNCQLMKESEANITELLIKIRYGYPTRNGIGASLSLEKAIYPQGWTNQYKKVNWIGGSLINFTIEFSFKEIEDYIGLSGFELDKTYYPLNKDNHTFISVDIYTKVDLSAEGTKHDYFSNICTLSPYNQITILPEYDNPRLIAKVERISDESKQVITSLKLFSDTSQAAISQHEYMLGYNSSTNGYQHWIATEKDFNFESLYNGIENSTDFINSTFTPDSDHYISIILENKYESAVAQVLVPRAFANLHLSGKSTGGVSFGAFGSSEENSPKLESHYPAYFYKPARFEKGIEGINNYKLDSNSGLGYDLTYGRWIDGAYIYKMVLEIPPLKASQTIDFNIDSISELVNISGYTYGTISGKNFIIPLNTAPIKNPTYGATAHIEEILETSSEFGQTFINKTILRISNNSGLAKKGGVVFLEFTTPSVYKQSEPYIWKSPIMDSNFDKKCEVTASSNATLAWKPFSAIPYYSDTTSIATNCWTCSSTDSDRYIQIFTSQAICKAFFILTYDKKSKYVEIPPTEGIIYGAKEPEGEWIELKNFTEADYDRFDANANSNTAYIQLSNEDYYSFFRIKITNPSSGVTGFNLIKISGVTEMGILNDYEEYLYG